MVHRMQRREMAKRTRWNTEAHGIPKRMGYRGVWDIVEA
jgi:hypothetical protein